MKYRILQFISSMLITSCNFSHHADKATLIESPSQIKLDVKQDVYLYSRCYRHYTHNNLEYIALSTNHYDKDFDEIVIYDITNTNESKRIPVYKKGPHSIGCGLSGFDFISHDSIVVTNKYLPQLYIINAQGEILQKHELNDENSTYSSMQSNINAPLVIFNDSIIEFPQDVPYWRNACVPNPTDFRFENCPLAYLINCMTNEAIPSKVGFPKLYENDNNINHDECYSRIFDGENFVYGFLTYDSLIVTSDHKTSKTYCAKSRYIGDVKNPGTPPGTAIPDIMRKLSTLASYGNIIYDPYREVYYRFCYFENDYPGPYTLEYTISGGAFTIMIIDKEFNVIGETVFPDKRYASKIFFVNKEGLWLSENHFLREDMTDDKLVFRCLKLEYF